MLGQGSKYSINLLIKRSISTVLEILRVFLFGFSFKKGYIHFSKPIIKLKSEKLGIPVTQGMLGGILRIDKHIRTTGCKDIIHAESKAGRLVFQEFVF